MVLKSAGFAFLRIVLAMRLDISNNATQCAEMILNKVEKTFNKTYTGLKSFLQRFQICFSQNPSCKGVESTS